MRTAQYLATWRGRQTLLMSATLIITCISKWTSMMSSEARGLVGFVDGGLLSACK
jgi:hypothetical protein